MSEKIISQEGYDKLKKELNFLSTNVRKKIAARIEKAKELGDLSENAEYGEAKDAQALNEGKIIELNNSLKNVTVVKTNNSKGKVAMGSTVSVKSARGKRDFTIVSFNEADPLNGKISNESPLGVAFLNKRQGEEVEVETPNGLVKYKIIKIS